MNTKPLSLEEVSKLVESGSVDKIDPRVQDFIGRVEIHGKEILQSRGENVGAYVESASHFLFASAMSECLEGRDNEDLMAAMVMSQNPKLFTLIIGYAFIYAVGLCAEEELR
jgi:hypothetical protein